MVRKLTALTVAVSVVLTLMAWKPRRASAGVFDDLGEGIVTVTGLRGAVRGLAKGATEGVREQLNQFIDEKVDPLIDRVNIVLRNQIETAKQSALLVIRDLETSLNEIIALTAERIDELDASFFARLNRTLEKSFGRLEDLLDATLCRIMPDGHPVVDLGPFGGSDQIRVKRPLHTHCYALFLESKGDPSVATFRRFDYFKGELCEFELKLNRIDPASSTSIEESIYGYDKLAEMANSARCAAPDWSAKAEMVQRLHLYQARAAFFRQFRIGTNE